MSAWRDCSERNLLALSEEKVDFRLACREWEHTGIVIDHLTANEVCQLCEQPNLRYHYEVANKRTDASLFVGSSCIEKFEIVVLDEEGNELLGDERSKRLQEELQEKQREMMLEPLRELWIVAEAHQRPIRSAVDELGDRGGIAPDKLHNLFQLMRKNGIEYAPQIYKVVLRSNKDKLGLLGLSQQEVELIWPSMSSSQRRKWQNREKWEQQFNKEPERTTARDLMIPRYQGAVGSVSASKYRRVAPQQTTIPTRKDVGLTTGLPLPAAPIRYVESAHRYTITFFDLEDRPIKRLFRGNLREIRGSIIRQELEVNPRAIKAEIRGTKNKELIDVIQRK